MDKNRKFEDIDNSIDEKLKEAYGYSDEQLLAEFEAAERQLQESPELLDELKPPDGEFEKIVARIDEIRGEEKAVAHKKIFRISKALRPIVAVALVGVLVMASAVGVAAKKSYYFKKRENGASNKVIWNNDDNLIKKGKAETAYETIKEELNMNVIELGYLPYEMNFVDLNISVKRAVINFSCDDKYIHMVEGQYETENSSGLYTDTLTSDKVYNTWLDMEIPIRENLLEDGSKEFTAEFGIGEAYYSLTGKIDEEIFIKIVEGLQEFD